MHVCEFMLVLEESTGSWRVAGALVNHLVMVGRGVCCGLVLGSGRRWSECRDGDWMANPFDDCLTVVGC